MKVGILTYHRSPNYGALLQAIALRYYLESTGNEATFIDYWPKYHSQHYALIKKNRLQLLHPKGTFLYLKHQLSILKTSIKRRNNAQHFIAKYIEPFISTTQESYDLIICGSDQIWRKQIGINEYNPYYFGSSDIQAARKISYAASMGQLPTTTHDKDKIEQLVSNLDAISVRENDLHCLLKELGINSEISLDPTFLLNSSEWDKLIPYEDIRQGEKYALFYEIMPDSFSLNEIKRFVAEKGLKLVILRSNPIPKETTYELCTPSACGFINLVRNAEFVFTSSFHGLVFSLIYHKPFYAAFSKNSGRAKSILQTTGLSDYLLPTMSQISKDYKPINYEKVDIQLQSAREASKKYLLDNINS